MGDKRWYDEDQEISSFWSWVIIIVFSGSIMAFGWTVYLLIPDGPRQWDFGQLGDAPAETIFSTDEPNIDRKARTQIYRLPEAQVQSPVPAERKPQGSK